MRASRPDDPKDPFPITDATSKPVATAGQHDVVVDQLRVRPACRRSSGCTASSTRRTAWRTRRTCSGQTDRQGCPIEPLARFATGANAMAPLDMASGMQTIANQGLHHDPYYVDYIDRADGTRLYTHDDPGAQVLDPGVALDRRSTC